MRRRRALLAAAIGLGAALLAAACAGGSDGEDELFVFAASSLTDAFTEAGLAFEAAHPGVDVRFNFAASAALAAQVNEGAKADVFASADTVQMAAVAARAGGQPAIFATNVPVVVVPASGSLVASFADLAKPGARLVLAGRDVPIGRYAREAIASAGRDGSLGADFEARALANVRSEEANVRAVLAKVQLGEADAGIVYATDVAAGGKDVVTVAIPQQWNVLAEYPIAAIGGEKAPASARAFVAFVLGPEGQAILAKHGFGKPVSR